MSKSTQVKIIKGLTTLDLVVCNGDILFASWITLSLREPVTYNLYVDHLRQKAITLVMELLGGEDLALALILLSTSPAYGDGEGIDYNDWKLVVCVYD